MAPAPTMSTRCIAPDSFGPSAPRRVDLRGWVVGLGLGFLGPGAKRIERTSFSYICSHTSQLVHRAAPWSSDPALFWDALFESLFYSPEDYALKNVEHCLQHLGPEVENPEPPACAGDVGCTPIGQRQGGNQRARPACSGPGWGSGLWVC